jgi:hypothetical protein
MQLLSRLLKGVPGKLRPMNLLEGFDSHRHRFFIIDVDFAILDEPPELEGITCSPSHQISDV